MASNHQELTLSLPTGALGLGIQMDRNGLCFVFSKHANSPLEVGDVIVSLNGMTLKDVHGGVEAWVKIFMGFAQMPRNAVVHRAPTSADRNDELTTFSQPLPVKPSSPPVLNATESSIDAVLTDSSACRQPNNIAVDISIDAPLMNHPVSQPVLSLNAQETSHMIKEVERFEEKMVDDANPLEKTSDVDMSSKVPKPARISLSPPRTSSVDGMVALPMPQTVSMPTIGKNAKNSALLALRQEEQANMAADLKLSEKYRARILRYLLNTKRQQASRGTIMKYTMLANEKGSRTAFSATLRKMVDEGVLSQNGVTFTVRNSTFKAGKSKGKKKPVAKSKGKKKPKAEPKQMHASNGFAGHVDFAEMAFTLANGGKMPSEATVAEPKESLKTSHVSGHGNSVELTNAAMRPNTTTTDTALLNVQQQPPATMFFQNAAEDVKGFGGPSLESHEGNMATGTNVASCIRATSATASTHSQGSHSENLTVFINKPSIESSLGIGIQDQLNGTVAVMAISPDSLFVGSGLRVGMTMESINGTKCATAHEAVALLKAGQGQMAITVIAPVVTNGGVNPAPAGFFVPSLPPMDVCIDK